jgi:hypothetical protein
MKVFSVITVIIAYIASLSATETIHNYDTTAVDVFGAVSNVWVYAVS